MCIHNIDEMRFFFSLNIHHIEIGLRKTFENLFSNQVLKINCQKEILAFPNLLGKKIVFKNAIVVKVKWSETRHWRMHLVSAIVVLYWALLHMRSCLNTFRWCQTDELCSIFRGPFTSNTVDIDCKTNNANRHFVNNLPVLILSTLLYIFTWSLETFRSF